MTYFCETSAKCLFCKANCELTQPHKNTRKDVNPSRSSIEELQATQSLSDDPSESKNKSSHDGLTEDKTEGDLCQRDVNCSCHKFPVPFLGSSTSKWENSEAYRDDLKYAFLLREILDYPKRKIVKYMNCFRENANKTGTGWFSVCEACAKVVEEGHQIYHDIEKLSLKLDRLKNSLRDLLILSQKESEIENQEDVEDEEENEGTTIFEEVREHVFPRKSHPTQSQEKDRNVGDIKMEIEGTLPLDGGDPFLDELLGNENFDEGSDWAPSDAEEFEGGDAADDDPIDVKPNIEDLEIEGQVGGNESGKKLNQQVSNKMERELLKLKPAPKSRKMLRLTRSSTRREEMSEENLADDDSQEETRDDERMNLSRPLELSNNRKCKRMKFKSIISDSESDSMSDSETSSHSDDKSGNKEKFPCKLCGSIYFTKHKLKAHERLHSSDDAFKCAKCPFVSASSRGLKMHTTKIHHKKQKEKLCIVENKKQSSTSTTTEDNSFSSFSLESGSPTKKTTSHKFKLLTSSELTCSYCPAKYQTVHRLKEHEEHHSRDDVIKCQQCNFVCLLERGMKIHVSKYHNRKEYNKIMTAKDESSEDVRGTTERQRNEEYKCKLCCAIYKSPHRIREHKQLHVSKQAIKCTECPYVCRTNKGLLMHTNLKHDVNLAKPKRKKVKLRTKTKVFTTEPRRCELCPAKYHTKKRFQQHMSLHSKKINFPCEDCGWVFSEGSKRDFHMRLSHNRTDIKYHRKAYQCIHCDTDPFTFRYKYKEHLRLNHEDKIVQCGTCNEICESQAFYDRHVRICRKREEISDGSGNEESDESGTEKKMFECTRCNSTFKQKINLKKHVATKHSSEEFPCEHCTSVFPTASRLRYHLARQHDKIQNVCKVCNYKAHGASHLRLHMQKHTKERLFACEMCGKTFVSPTYLTAHKQKEHYEELGMDPIKCDQCDLLLPTKSILKYHIQKIHEKKFKFFCEVCGKGFLFASGLKNHAAAHSTERSEICQFCGASYVYNRVLQEHIKNHHPDEYASSKGLDPSSFKPPVLVNTQGPFICKLCNQEFPFRWGLHHHMKTHTEVFDKYKCAICGKGYSSPAGVKRHEETAHVANTYSCQDCGKTFPCRDYLRYHMKNHCHKKEGQQVVTTTELKSEPSSSLMKKNKTQKSDMKHDPHIVKEAGQLHIVTPNTAAVASSSGTQLSHGAMTNFPYSQIQPGSSASSSSSSYVTNPQVPHPQHQLNDTLGDADAVNSFYRSFFSQHGLSNK